MVSKNQLASETSGQQRWFLNSEFSTQMSTPLEQMIVKRKILFPAPGWTMLRQFSCKQLYRKGNCAQVMHEQICLINDGNVHYVSSGKRREADVYSLVSRDADEKCTFSGARKQSSIPLGQKNSFTKNFKRWLTCCLFLLIAIGVFMMFTFVGSNGDTCQYTLKTNVLEQVLKYKLYGQEQAKREIMTHLMMFSISEGPSVMAMVFYGEIGVGKSYTASLIGKYFSWPRNIQHLVLSVHDHSISCAAEVVSRLTLCGDNLVIVDGLAAGQENTIVLFLNELAAASKSSLFRIIVILIFNGKQSNEKPFGNRVKIESSFKVKTDLILFQPLEEQHIRMCIREALSQQGIMMSKEDVDHLLSVIVPLGSGCKSVASKVAVLGGKQM